MPIINAIETILSTDVRTKDRIKVYRQVSLPEQGVWATPLCVLAPDLDIAPNLSGFGPTILRNRKFPLEILFLGRSDNTQDLHKAAVTELDALQHNACLVFEDDPTLSSSVANSKIERIQLMQFNEEYFMFKLSLMLETKLE